MVCTSEVNNAGLVHVGLYGSLGLIVSILPVVVRDESSLRTSSCSDDDAEYFCGTRGITDESRSGA